MSFLAIAALQIPESFPIHLHWWRTKSRGRLCDANMPDPRTLLHFRLLWGRTIREVGALESR